jgi:hypothetical protein
VLVAATKKRPGREASYRKKGRHGWGGAWSREPAARLQQGRRVPWLLEVEDDGENCSQGEAPAGKMEARASSAAAQPWERGGAWEAAGGRRPWRRSCAQMQP